MKNISTHLCVFDFVLTLCCVAKKTDFSKGGDVEDRRDLYILSVLGSLWCFNSVTATQKTKRHSEVTTRKLQRFSLDASI